MRLSLVGRNTGALLMVFFLIAAGAGLAPHGDCGAEAHSCGSPPLSETGCPPGCIAVPVGAGDLCLFWDMAHQMSGDELDRFLSAGSPTGKLATVRADGSPHVAPIWFILHQDDLVFMTGAETVKGKNMLRDPRVVLLVEDERPPFAFATVEGTVSISRNLDEMLPLSIAIARRYMGDELAEQYGRRNAVEGELLLRLRRVRVTAVAEIAD